MVNWPLSRQFTPVMGPPADRNGIAGCPDDRTGAGEVIAAMADLSSTDEGCSLDHDLICAPETEDIVNALAEDESLFGGANDRDFGQDEELPSGIMGTAWSQHSFIDATGLMDTHSEAFRRWGSVMPLSRCSWVLLPRRDLVAVGLGPN